MLLFFSTGYIEYWSPGDYKAPPSSGPGAVVKFTLKMDTDLFALAKAKTHARSLEVSTSGVGGGGTAGIWGWELLGGRGTAGMGGGGGVGSARSLEVRSLGIGGSAVLAHGVNPSNDMHMFSSGRAW